MHAYSPAEVHRVYEHSFEAHNVDEALDLYEPDAILMVEPGCQVSGADAIRAALAQSFAVDGRMKIETVAVVATGSTALLRSRWTVEGTAPDGSPVSVVSEGNEVVRRCADGTWRFVIDNPWATASLETA